MYTAIAILTVLHFGWLVYALCNPRAPQAQPIAAPAPIGDPERVWRERDARRRK